MPWYSISINLEPLPCSAAAVADTILIGDCKSLSDTCGLVEGDGFPPGLGATIDCDHDDAK